MMKFKLILYSALTAVLLLNGCLRTYYPAAFYSSAPPIIFENTEEKDSSSKYIGLDFTATKSNYNESLQILKFGYLRADTRNFFNFNWDLHGYTGLYNVSGLTKYNGSKYFVGLGTDAKMNLNMKIENFRLGLGFNAGFGAELGEYYNFRKTAESEHLITDENTAAYFKFSVFPVMAYEITESTIISTQANLGIPGLISPSLVLNNSGYIYWLSFVPDQRNYYNRIVFGFLMNLNKTGLNF